MNKLQFEVPEGANVRLTRADSEVGIRGWDQDTVEVILDGESDQCTAQQDGSVLTIESDVALSISVPPATVLDVGEVGGDLSLRELSGPVSVEVVHGEAMLRACAAPITLKAVHGDVMVDVMNAPLTANDVHGDVRLEQANARVVLGAVHGDVRARGVHADLEVGSANGDVRVREVTGLVSVEDAKGDFQGTDLHAGAQVNHVSGDLMLKTALTPGATYRCRADGDVIARLPQGTSARFTLEAKGSLMAKLPNVEEKTEGRMVGQAGDGEANVELSAGGSLVLKIRGDVSGGPSFSFGFGPDIAAEVEAQIAESLGSIDIDAMAQREIEKAMRKAEREMEKAREHAEREMRKAEEQMQRAEREQHRAQEHMRRAQERAERAARRAQERVARHHGQRMGMFGEPVTFEARRRSPKPKVSKEDQLAVLKMLQEGTISAEQAEALLKALEG